MKRVGILLAAYNGQEFLNEQINSILNQKNVSISIFISLDLSTDSSFEIINTLANKNKNIIFLPYGEKFGSAAPNFYRLLMSVDFSDFDYIALSDQDDIWLDDKLYSAIEKLENNNCYGYSSNVTAFWSNGKQKIIKKATPQRKYDYLFEGPGPGCSFVVKREFANEFKYYAMTKKNDLRNLDWHDWLIYAYARSKKYSWYIDKKSHMLYRQHQKNQLGANKGFSQLIKRIRDITSGYGIKQSINTIKFLNMENDEFVKTWLKCDFISFLKLAHYSYYCRRKLSDRILFIISCIVMAINNPFHQHLGINK